MSARDDYPLHRALEALNGGPSALAEIDRLRAEVEFLETLAISVAVRCVRDPDTAQELVADEREQINAWKERHGR